MLKAVVSDLEQVEENLREYYTEQDGKFFLNVTPVEGYSLENVNGMKTALAAERRARSDLEVEVKAVKDRLVSTEEKLTNFAGIDPEQVRKDRNRLEKLTKLDPEKEAERLAEEKAKAREEQLLKKHEEAVNALSLKLESVQNEFGQKLTRREQQVRDLLLKATVEPALAKLNPLDDARDAISLLAMRSIRVDEVDGEFTVRVVDDNGNPRIKDVQGALMGVDDYLKELREKRPALFRPDEVQSIGIKPNGAVSGKSGMKNPFMKGPDFNLTEQMRLLKEDPSAAKRLQEAANSRSAA